MFNVGNQLQELRSTIIVSVLILAATIIGFVWISLGLYSWLSLCIGPIWGPMVLGLIFFIPIIVLAFVKAFARSAAQQAPQIREQDLAIQAFTKACENMSSRSPFVVVAAATVAGLLAARFPTLLTLCTQLLAAYANEVKNRAASSQTAATSTTAKPSSTASSADTEQ